MTKAFWNKYDKDREAHLERMIDLAKRCLDRHEETLHHLTEMGATPADLTFFESTINFWKDTLAKDEAELEKVRERLANTRAEEDQTRTEEDDARAEEELTRVNGYADMPDGSKLIRVVDGDFVRLICKTKTGNYIGSYNKGEGEGLLFYKDQDIIRFVDASNEFLEIMLRSAIKHHIGMRLGKKRRRTQKHIRQRAEKVDKLLKECSALINCNTAAKARIEGGAK